MNVYLVLINVLAISNLFASVSSLPAVIIEKIECESPLCLLVNQTLPEINEQTNENVCLTAGCNYAAQNAIDYMDLSIEPCDDFYQFACGNFAKESNESDDIFSRVQHELNAQLHALISEKIDPNDPAPFNMAKRLYNACMNESQIEEHGLEPLLSITDKMGGWPVVKGDQWNENADWNWIETIKHFNSIGYSADYIFGFTIATDLKNTTARTLYVSYILFLVHFK